ncbi:SDR family NAD(P)-dependent oxidoreductase, partial [Streptomyces sp. G35A]
MRGILASSIGVTCAAALALPLAPPATASAERPAPTAGAATRAAVTAESDVPGSTRSLPLRALPRDRVSGAAVFGLAPRVVRHFSLLGVVWDDPAAELHGHVRVRTRSAAVDAGFGRIVNLSSSSALGNRGQVNYSAAKAGLQGFTKTLAKE